jgi:hypothetical protein
MLKLAPATSRFHHPRNPLIHLFECLHRPAITQTSGNLIERSPRKLHSLPMLQISHLLGDDHFSASGQASSLTWLFHAKIINPKSRSSKIQIFFRILSPTKQTNSTLRPAKASPPLKYRFAMETPTISNATAAAKAPVTKKSITDAALAANRQNSQKSTGPKTEQGREKSSANSLRHGLTAASPTFLNPEAQADFERLKQQLSQECLPTTALEQQAFDRYAFSTYQAQRAQRLEADTQDRWIENPDHPEYFQQMERFIKLTALLERRADKALNELRKLQRDRLAALHIHNELYLLNKKVDLPATLPAADMLKGHYRDISPGMLAMLTLSYTPEVRDILNNQTPPPETPDLQISDEDLMELIRQAGQIK